MKEIKAYIRPDALEPVIRELENAGAGDLTVIRVFVSTVDEAFNIRSGTERVAAL